FLFLPQRMELIGSNYGLLISERGSSLSFGGVAFEPAFDIAYLNTYWERRNNTFGSNYFAQISLDGIAVIVAELPFINTLNVSTSTFSQDELPFDSVTLGLGVVARPATDFFELTLINWANMPPVGPHFELLGWSTLQPAFSDPTAGVVMFPDASSVKVPGKFLYFGATGYFYLSCGLDDGSRAIYRWPDSSIDTLAPIKYPEDHGPLIGGLADGRLLAEKDGLLSVLNPDLGLLFAFRSGSLRFVHERYDAFNSRMITVFTRTLYARSNGGEGTLRVEIYEIPSSELEKLGD
ncbi:MAG: hypothetical protein AB7T74_14720, partial [Clostridia bacterium]